MVKVKLKIRSVKPMEFNDIEEEMLQEIEQEVEKPLEEKYKYQINEEVLKILEKDVPDNK